MIASLSFVAAQKQLDGHDTENKEEPPPAMYIGTDQVEPLNLTTFPP